LRFEPPEADGDERQEQDDPKKSFHAVEASIDYTGTPWVRSGLRACILAKPCFGAMVVFQRTPNPRLHNLRRNHNSDRKRSSSSNQRKVEVFTSA
jgi:hypothetical protein